MQEIWKDIIEYEGLYQVSNLGRVRNIKKISLKLFKSKTNVMATRLNHGGYVLINLTKDSKQISYSVHRLEMAAFRGVSNLQVNHKDGVQHNNDLENLEYVTTRQNSEHRHGLNCGAQFSKKSKFNPWQSGVRIKGKFIHLGMFKTKQEAVDARTEFLRLRGEEVYSEEKFNNSRKEKA